MHAHNQTNRLSSAFLRGGRIALWASMFLAVPLIVCSHDLFALYLGSEYPAHVDAATVMIILLLGFPFTYPTTMYFRIAYAMGDMRRIAIRAIAAQLSNLALTIVLVGPLQLGAIGSASATLVAFVIGHPILYWPLALKALQLSWRKFITESLAPGLCPSVIAGVAGWLATQAAGPSIAVRSAVGVSVCLVAYAIALLFVLKPSDRADLGRIRKAVRI
jgi:Na+-driven multidrug efflux pump